MSGIYWRSPETGKTYSLDRSPWHDDQNTVASWIEVKDKIASKSYTQKDLELLRARNKKVRIRAVLLDDNYNEVSDLVGTIRSTSYDIDSDSDIRRVSTLTMLVQDKSNLNNFEEIWISHMVELSIGIYDAAFLDYVWYPLGRMLMKSGSSKYNATTQEVKMSLVDLMANVTEDRGSQMGVDMLIPAGSNIRNALISVITTLSEFKRYNIPEFEDVVPYDIEVSAGSYPFEALKSLLGLFPYYEMFFDHEGIFTVQQIPTKIEDEVDIGADVIDELLIDVEKNSNFNVVKNTTEIWGRELNPKYMSTSCVSNNGTYKLTIDEYENLTTGDTFGFVPDAACESGQMLGINNIDPIKIYVESGTGYYSELSDEEMQVDVAYVVKYVDIDEPRFVLQGELFIHVIVQEVAEMPSEEEQARFIASNACNNVRWIVNPDSPYACTLEPTTGRIEREIRQVLEGGEYSSIYTTQLAYERASYENWLKTRVQDTVTLQMILIPWMDVNQKIQFTSPISGEVETLIVQSISYDFARWTMTVKGRKFYPYYPW